MSSRDNTNGLVAQIVQASLRVQSYIERLKGCFNIEFIQAGHGWLDVE